MGVGVTPVAKSVPFDSDVTVNDALGSSVQDFIDRISSPTISQAVTYLVNGEVDFIEFFSSATQITANRLYRVDIGYDGSLNPITETWKLYDTANGTTILKTVTFTNTFSGFNLTTETKTVV